MSPAYLSKNGKEFRPMATTACTNKDRVFRVFGDVVDLFVLVSRPFGRRDLLLAGEILTTNELSKESVYQQSLSE